MYNLLYFVSACLEVKVSAFFVAFPMASNSSLKLENSINDFFDSRSRIVGAHS